MKNRFKKAVLTALITANLLTLSSCGKVTEYALDKLYEIASTAKINRYSRDFDNRKVNQKKVESFFEAVNNNDKEAIKAMFSPKAIADSGNADEQIDFLLERFGGRIESWDYDAMASGANIEYGTYKKAHVWITYYFEADEVMYRISTRIYPIDIENPDNVGFYCICIEEKSKYIEMLEGKREVIMQPEMEEHPIIWIPDLPELEE